MPTLSSDNLEDVLDVLAKKAVYNAEFRRTKAAFLPQLQQLGSGAMDALKANPAAGAGLLGAGLGGAYGLATSFGRPEEERQPWSSALTGALAGGALGAGAGVAYDQLGPGIRDYFSGAVAGGGAAGGGSPGGAAGPTFMHNGQQYRLRDPAAASQLLPELQSLDERNPITRGVGAVGDVISNYTEKHPWLATMLGADIGSHALGTAAEMSTAGRGGAATLGHFNKGLGALKPDGTQFTGDHIDALKRWAGDQTPESFHSNYQNAVRNGAGVSLPGKPGKGGVPGAPTTISAQQLRDVGRAGTGRIRPGGVRSLLDILGDVTPEGWQRPGPLFGTGHGNEGELIADGLRGAGDQLRGGINAAADKIPQRVKTPFQQAGTGIRGAAGTLASKLPQRVKSPLHALWDRVRGSNPTPAPGPGHGLGLAPMPSPPRPTPAAPAASAWPGRIGGATQKLLQRAHTFQRPTSLVGRLAPRAGLYAGLPMLQWYMGQSAAENTARQRIQDLLKQYAVPTGE